MKFLIRGKCLALALRLLEEGNQVRLSDPFSKDTGKGIVQLVEFEQGVRWADVVVFDINDGDLPQESEKLRKSGVNVVGSSEFAGKLENDRQFGARIAREAGIEVKPFYSFKGQGAFRDALGFVSTQDKKSEWVWKSDDSSPDDPPTYVGKGGVELFERMLRHYEQLYKFQKRTPSFVLCPVVKGVEVSTEGWFNGKQFFLANHTIEKNRLHTGDLGPKTGCSGCVVWSANESKLYQHLIPRFASALAGKYCGPFDVNSIIDEETNEPVFLEFTPRFGYDAIYALLELLDGDLGSLLSSVARGELCPVRLKEQFAVTARLHIPPYPEDSGNKYEAKGVPIGGFDPTSYQRHISPCDLMLDDDGEVVCASPGGQLFAISDVGQSIDEAYEKVYKHITGLEIPQVGFRVDLSEAVGKVHDELVKTKWIGALASKPRSLTELLKRRA